MGVYAKSTRNKKFFKKRPKKGAKRVNNRVAKMSDLMRLSKQVSSTREHKVAFTSGSFVFGSYNAPNVAAVPQTWTTVSMAIDGTAGFAIPQGIIEGTRIGQEIRVKRVTLKMNFTAHPLTVSNPQPQPQIVKIYIGYSKPQLAISRQALPSTALDFFRFGNSNSSPLGTTFDLNRSINSDLYSIVKKSKAIKLGNRGYLQGQSSVQDFQNNDYDLFRTYSADLTKFYIKTQKFNETDSGSSSRGLYMYVTTVNGAGDVYTGFPVDCKYEVKMEFTDA